MTTTFAPDTLIAYRGGGYDGCVWEWNFAYVDDAGCYHDIYSSGTGGCATLTAAEAAYARRPGDFELTDLLSPKARDRFADTTAVSQLLGVARWFARRGDPVVFRPRCNDCGQRFNAAGGTGTAHASAGGLVITATRVACPDCVAGYTCDRCGEYYGPDYDFTESAGYSQLCEGCAELITTE